MNSPFVWNYGSSTLNLSGTSKTFSNLGGYSFWNLNVFQAP